MATIDYKEKYEQAMERARQFFEKPYLEDSAWIVGYIFPELKESKDERIRKWLINLLGEMQYHHCDDEREMGNKALAWLEKQGEHAKFINGIQVGDKVTRNEDGVLVNLSQLKRVAKPADRVEPKFKVGDTITDPTDSTFTFHINAIKDGKYMESDKDWVLIKEADSDYELVEQKSAWSEEDEKMLNDIIMCGEHHCYLDAGNIAWLKSLRPQNTWKPNEEQISVLEFVMEDIEKDSIRYAVLNSVLEQLKKLKE